MSAKAKERRLRKNQCRLQMLSPRMDMPALSRHHSHESCRTIPTLNLKMGQVSLESNLGTPMAVLCEDSDRTIQCDEFMNGSKLTLWKARQEWTSTSREWGRI